MVESKKTTVDLLSSVGGDNGDVPTVAPVVAVATRPVPEATLTDDQRRIRDLEDQLARSQGKKDFEPGSEPLVNPGSEENILIHFLEDGFTALGQVWYRGEEIEFEPGSQAYKDTCDRNGKSWLDMRNDEMRQADRYGKIMFRSGPWPGKGYTAGRFSAMKTLSGDGKLATPSSDELSALDEKVRQARRFAPTLPRM